MLNCGRTTRTSNTSVLSVKLINCYGGHFKYAKLKTVILIILLLRNNKGTYLYFKNV